MGDSLLGELLLLLLLLAYLKPLLFHELDHDIDGVIDKLAAMEELILLLLMLLKVLLLLLLLCNNDEDDEDNADAVDDILFAVIVGLVAEVEEEYSGANGVEFIIKLELVLGLTITDEEFIFIVRYCM